MYSVIYISEMYKMIEITFCTKSIIFVDGPSHPNPCQNGGICQDDEKMMKNTLVFVSQDIRDIKVK